MQDFGLSSLVSRNGKSSEKTASGKVMTTKLYNEVAKERSLVCEVNQFSNGNERISQFMFEGKDSSNVTIRVDNKTGEMKCTHPSVVCEQQWVLKNIELFKKVYTEITPKDVPRWFNEMFLESMDTLMYGCECDSLPEVLTEVYDYILYMRGSLSQDV